MPDAKKQQAGRKGGQVVSKDRAHMAAIGRKGGQRSHLKRAEKQQQNDASQERSLNDGVVQTAKASSPDKQPVTADSENAVAILKADHRRVNSLFEDYETAGGADKIAIAEKIMRELEIHSAVEEELFYPAVKEKAGRDGQEYVAEALEAHRSVKTAMRELKALDAEDETFESAFMDMMHDVQHHVDEEEGEILPLAEEALGDSLEELGSEIMRRKHDFLESAANEPFTDR